MSARAPRFIPALCGSLALVGWLSAGCGTAQKPAGPAGKAAVQPDHDHGGHDGHEDHAHDHAAEHDHPRTLADGVAELETLTKDVAAKLAEDAQDAADHAVHAAAHLIEDVRELLATETISADAREAATKAVDEIFECFDKLDVALHSKAKEGAETVAEIHASVADRIAKAVEALKERFPKEEK